MNNIKEFADAYSTKELTENTVATVMFKSKDYFSDIIDTDNTMNVELTNKLEQLKTVDELQDIIDTCKKLQLKKEKNYDHEEEILKEENRRFTVYPIKYPDIWDTYKKQLACFWKTEEIDFSTDKDDFEELALKEQDFLKMILAFFAASDGIVNFNLAERFTKDVKVMEAQITYAFQMMMENQHGETYSLMLDNIITDVNEKKKLFNAIETIPAVKKMADWAFKWIQSSKSFAHRCVAFAAIEGIFFSGAFAAIFWFKKFKNKGKMFLKGLVKSNEFIARDEGLHCDFACLLYSKLKYRLSNKEINNIITEAVEISQEFMNDSLPYELLGMNKDKMAEYIEYIGDRLLLALGYSKIYNKSNPFKFMETIGLQGKTNFFEMRPTEYQDAHVFNVDSNKDYYEFGDDF